METHKKVAQSQAPNRRLCPFAKKGWDQLPVWAEEKESWEAGAPSWALECQGAGRVRSSRGQPCAHIRRGAVC